jgi:sterol desaturase/sphingolipid hydroxylase (fatty acid hydroxylase superfamily)
MHVGMEERGPDTSRWKWWAILAILVVGLIVVGLAIWLYQLGGPDQSALERIRDITIIFLAFQLLLVTIILGGIAAGLGFLIVVLKDQIIPLLHELKGTAAELTDTAKRVKSTTDFVTEEAVKPIITTAGQVAKVRAMVRTVTGADRKRR